MSADTKIREATEAQISPSSISIQELKNKVAHLNYLAEGLNGPNTFSVESAAYGYIERHKRLIIPEDLRAWIGQNKISWEDKDQAASVPLISLFSIAYWNFSRLLAGGYSKDNAMFVAVYRTRLIYMGYLYASKEDRCVTIDEVDYTTAIRDHHTVAYETEAKYKQAADAAKSQEAEVAAYLEFGTNEKFKRFISALVSDEYAEMNRFLTLASNQYAAMTYLVFRQHGHHYTTELDKKLNTLWKATTLEQSPKYPGNEAVHRDAIHSFGMKALHDKFYYFLEKGKLAETFIDRQDVAPAGTAIIATCYASITLMRSLPIWSGIYAQYKEQIDKLEEQAKKLKDAKGAIKYHKNARLFGHHRFTLDTEIAQALAPVAVGFIQSLGDEADLSQQKTLNKRAQQNPLMVNLTFGVIRTVLRRIAKSGEIAPAISGERKQIEAPKVQSRVEEEEEEEEEELYT